METKIGIQTALHLEYSDMLVAIASESDLGDC